MANLAATGSWHWAGNQKRRFFYYVSNNRFTTGYFVVTQGKYISTAWRWLLLHFLCGPDCVQRKVKVHDCQFSLLGASHMLCPKSTLQTNYKLVLEHRAWLKKCLCTGLPSEALWEWPPGSWVLLVWFLWQQSSPGRVLVAPHFFYITIITALEIIPTHASPQKVVAGLRRALIHAVSLQHCNVDESCLPRTHGKIANFTQGKCQMWIQPKQFLAHHVFHQ